MTIAAGSKEDGEGDDRMHASQLSPATNHADKLARENRLGQLYSLLISVIFYPLDRTVLRL